MSGVQTSALVFGSLVVLMAFIFWLVKGKRVEKVEEYQY